jgi:hypothetical protein
LVSAADSIKGLLSGNGCACSDSVLFLHFCSNFGMKFHVFRDTAINAGHFSNIEIGFFGQFGYTFTKAILHHFIEHIGGKDDLHFLLFELLSCNFILLGRRPSTEHDVGR